MTPLSQTPARTSALNMWHCEAVCGFYCTACCHGPVLLGTSLFFLLMSFLMFLLYFSGMLSISWTAAAVADRTCGAWQFISMKLTGTRPLHSEVLPTLMPPLNPWLPTWVSLRINVRGCKRIDKIGKTKQKKWQLCLFFLTSLTCLPVSWKKSHEVFPLLTSKTNKGNILRREHHCLSELLLARPGLRGCEEAFFDYKGPQATKCGTQCCRQRIAAQPEALKAVKRVIDRVTSVSTP